jgi:hypothetical protein
MSWETAIAHRLFPHDQKFMAKRKLRIALWTAVVAVLAAGLFIGILLVAQRAQGRP